MQRHLFGVPRALLSAGTLSVSVRYLCIGRLGRVPQWSVRRHIEGDVKRSTGLVIPEVEQSCAEQLARFFPQVAAVRVPVQVTALRGGNTKLREATVLEFAAADVAIFVSTLPLEFDDRVRLERSQKSRPADATVIAVQYHEGRKAVAVRFTKGPCEWVTQP